MEGNFKGRLEEEEERRANGVSNNKRKFEWYGIIICVKDRLLDKKNNCYSDLIISFK